MSGSLSYQPRLDGLRFIAVFCVLLFHFAAPVGQLFSSGSYGVNLFFVLSGFLITSILIKDVAGNSGAVYKNFLGRRALRIFPIYYLSLLVLYLIRAPHIEERMPWLLSYTYNLVMPYVHWKDDFNIPFWSLSVEEQFYVFFPLLAIGLRRNLKVFAAACILLICMGWLQAIFDVFRIGRFQGNLHVFNYTSLLTNMAPLCLGSLTAIVLKGSGLPKFLLSLEAELIAFVAIVVSVWFLPWKFQLVVCSLSNCIIVAKAWTGGFSFKLIDRLTTQRILVYIGRISYGVYIYHKIVSGWMDMHVVHPFWSGFSFAEGSALYWLQTHPYVVTFPLYSLLSVGLAHLSFRWIEKPILRLKDVYFKAGAREEAEEVFVATETLSAQRSAEV